MPLPVFDYPTLVATSLPQPQVGTGGIQILAPGPLSKITSPVKVYGYTVPGYNNLGLLELYGEDGRLMGHVVLSLYASSINQWSFFYWEMPFKVDAAAELGRLTFSTQDDFGRVTAANSVHVLMMPEGLMITNPPGNLQEHCVIDTPIKAAGIYGGVVNVSGKMRPFNKLPLVVELVTRDNRVVGSQLVDVVPTPDDGYVPFRADVSYSISSGSWALLVVRQADDRIGGTMYLYSREIFLYP
jgi:hypothetical protein